MANRFSILVIDDEPSVADALQMILTEGGYDVTVALSARDGLRQAGQRRFDLVITDFLLPDMNGLEVILNVRENSPHSRAVLITAHNSHEITSMAAEFGVQEVLFKPFPPAVISECVRRTLGTED